MHSLRFIFILFLPIFFIVVFTGCRHEQHNEQRQHVASPYMEAHAIMLKPQALENKIMTTGTVLANEEVELRSEVEGRVVQINFREGSRVGKGDLLIKINDAELQAQLKKLLLDEQLARDDLFRKEKLLEINAVSREEYDISQNQLGVIQAQIDLLRSQLDKTEIHAPFNGLIGLRYISPGGYVTSDMLIARLQETNPVKIEFTVPEKYRNKIEPGTVIQFTIEGQDSIFTGKVYALEPKIDPLTRTVTVRALCTNNANVLIPGAFAKVGIILETIPDALVIPSEALIPDIRGEKVFVCTMGQAKAVYVVTGIRLERTVQITEGLTPGDTILTTGLLQLRDGMKVNPALQ
jgi:membrane fusion protein (multidrug efflux system)